MTPQIHIPGDMYVPWWFKWGVSPESPASGHLPQLVAGDDRERCVILLGEDGES